MALPFGNITANYLSGEYNKPATGESIGNFIHNIVTAVFLVSGLATFAFLILGGLRYLTSSGDAKAMESATKIITNAVIGLLIVLGSYGIARIVESVFGVSIFNPTFQGP
ncbi:MAG: hypothetical protein AAB486_01700 [Patescibacteria group bacterium]